MSVCGTCCCAGMCFTCSSFLGVEFAWKAAHLGNFLVISIETFQNGSCERNWRFLWYSIPTTDLQPSESEDTNKISSTFKISIVCIVVLIFQTILNSFIVTAFDDNQNDTGEHAIGMAFVALILIVGKFILSFPTILLSTIGIVKKIPKKNKGKRLNQNGFIINIACLVISELQVFFWWWNASTSPSLQEPPFPKPFRSGLRAKLFECSRFRPTA